MKLKNREGTRVVILGDSPQDAKRAAILKKDGYTEVAEAPEPKVKGVPATNSETPSEFAGMTKTDLVAHLEAAGRDPKELKALKKEELVVLAQQAADAEAAKTDGEEETQP
ncbi:MAG: hypothetical protein ACK5XS_10250 [Armatimonadota bacterium]|jgi:hypothetical protein|nr:hypothetical protein [Fimbriimonadaceae bacterium]